MRMSQRSDCIYTITMRKNHTIAAVILTLSFISGSRCLQAADDNDDRASVLPTGKRITPSAAPGAHFEALNPGLPDFPAFVVGQAISTAVSPDNHTLLILTSGYNLNEGPDGNNVAEASQEYVFVYDIRTTTPRQRQVLKVRNTFVGICFSPDGKEFYVTGGKDDNVHTFLLASNGQWQEMSAPIPLGHSSGLGLNPGKEPLAAGGIAVTTDGHTLVVANIYNDSISLIDLPARKVSKELDLRPGKIHRSRVGVPGGEYPFWVTVKGNSTAYVSSVRDREIVVVSLGRSPAIQHRIKLAGTPNKMILNRDQSRLFVTADNTDTVTIIDTRRDRITETVLTTAPDGLLENPKGYTGSVPNSAALSPDERTLYVTNGGTNSVAMIRLGAAGSRSAVVGLLPTGWYPNAVSVSADGRTLYVVNGKSVAGPNRDLHVALKTDKDLKPGPAVVVNSRNQYIFQLEKAGFLTAPVPDDAALERLTRLVAANNHFDSKPDPRDEMVMGELRKRIQHVIYIIKENRTYDQVLGDLDRGNGDPSLAEFGERLTPNFHKIARQFVDLDNFYDTGEVSGDGWQWSTSGRETDFAVKAMPLQYADRGTSYEYEGINRNINVGLPTVAERKMANPKTPSDPDLLPGTANVAEPDGPKGAPQGKGYIWDAVLRAGLTFREYGCMSDTNLDAPREPHPFQANVVMSRPANPELYKYGDPFFRGFDPAYPDFYREAEWQREFDEYVAKGNLPAFEIVQLPVDHMGDFEVAIAGVNTPELQQADNDYAMARLVERVAHSPYKDSTLIFSTEDDAQDGPDHVDAHRTTAYVIGPYVKHGAVVSTYYTTVNMVRTIEDVLGLEHLNLNTATERPMTEVFDLNQKDWTFDAAPSAILANTKLPIPASAFAPAGAANSWRPSHDSSYWAEKTAGFDFSGGDRVDADKFNRIVWEGVMGTVYPTERSHADLRSSRETILMVPPIAIRFPK
jgi:DNA-binding beta-propeller fold protein YncE